MDLFKNFIFRNNGIISETLLGYDLVENCSKEQIKSLLLGSDVVEVLLGNCESLFEYDSYFLSLGQGHEQVHISMKILLGYYNSIFFLIDYNTEEDESVKVEVYDKTPINHSYKLCKEKFEWIETLLDGYDEHKDNTEFTEDFSLEVNWGFDFLQYLTNNGFDTSVFLGIQNKLDKIN
jgi:hypothetical protein